MNATRTKPARRRWLWYTVAIAAVVVLLGGIAAALEFRTSYFQSRFFAERSRDLGFAMDQGPSPSIRFPGQGPYDLRYGYSKIPELTDAFVASGFAVDSQARVSERFASLMDRGLSPIYHAKDRAGLRILDRSGLVMFDGRYPDRGYPAFDSIPDLVWQTLLFVENRTLLDSTTPLRNPAVDWQRLIRAAAGLGGRRFGRDGSVAGASTLATQLEKFRHAPEGRTLSPTDKLRQMESASYRAYLDGTNTMGARQEIVTSYLNSMPLAGIAGYGEVTGLGDGLWAWFGASFEDVNRYLREAADSTVSPHPARHGRAYRQVLNLIMAVQRPSYFLTDHGGIEALERRADRYLNLLAREGVISPALRDAAREAATRPNLRAPERPTASFIERKAVNAVRTELLTTGRIPAFYQLDRYDATARTTFDGPAQAAVTDMLLKLQDSAYIAAAGLSGYRLLQRGDPAKVHYAFLLYERTPNGNAVRIQVDNVDGPFSPIEGAKLELGSTAKLRTLITYLETIESLHADYSSDSAQSASLRRDDPLTVWVRQTLAARPKLTVAELLEAAMERRYSASPRERFMTGGGVHTFRNFETTFDQQTVTVREAFRHSINLPFIRMMRDIVQYHMHRLPGHPAPGVLSDRSDPRRQEYLARFADREGRQFLDQFLRKHAWTTRDSALATLVRDRSLSAQRLAWIFRVVAPDEDASAFTRFLQATLGEQMRLSPAHIREIFDRANPASFSLVDRGFLAGIHPLELWLVEFKLSHPGATRAEMMDSSRTVRQDVYQWLFSTRRTQAQDQRIRSILEIEAFFEVHARWRRLGYPFASLVPSYATAIGSSADRPDQLAELIGIVLNDGVGQASTRISELRLADSTPFATVLRRPPSQGERLLSADLAAVVRRTMIDVVERGTGRRAYGTVKGPDGKPLPIGAKTGTGNNRFRVFGQGGRVVEDRALNRTSTLVFFVGDRFYGVLTAFVLGAEADDFSFTSSLPAQIFQMLGPALTELAATPESASP